MKKIYDPILLFLSKDSEYYIKYSNQKLSNHRLIGISTKKTQNLTGKKAH